MEQGWTVDEGSGQPTNSTAAFPNQLTRATFAALTLVDIHSTLSTCLHTHVGIPQSTARRYLMRPQTADEMWMEMS